MNQVALIGRLTQDPETRYYDETNAVAHFSIAINSGAKDKEKTDFIRCVCFGKTAEFISKYLRKGNRIGVSGRLRSGSYEKDGQRYYTLEVVATRVDFADSKAAEATEGVAEDMLKNEPKFEYENPFGPLPDEDVLPFD